MNFSRNSSWRLSAVAAATTVGLGVLAAGPNPLVAQTARVTPPPRVEFPSADGKTRIVGYVFMPTMAPGSRVPAVVMMHGRQGPYSTLAKDVFDGSTLSKRHQFWGRFWADSAMWRCWSTASDRAAMRAASGVFHMIRARRSSTR